jgi:hypothetical protein
LLDTMAASVSHLPSNIDHQMLGQKYTFGADKRRSARRFWPGVIGECCACISSGMSQRD